MADRGVDPDLTRLSLGEPADMAPSSSSANIASAG